MNDLRTPPDQAARDRALDPGRSFLVQAPAGAGKTELLVRRYLRLLAVVNEPEEILAVTFTRKAAAEMQQRIVAALAMTEADLADAGTSPQLRQLVAAVRARDAARNWQLALQPARLRISTIDALNAALARSAPVSGGASALRPVAEQPERLYRLASRATLRLLGEADDAGRAVAALLTHLDNDPARAEELLAQLLARRDQWLPFIGAGLDTVAARAKLEAGLARLVAAEIDRVEAAIPHRLGPELVEIVHAAAINRQHELADPRAPTASVQDRLAWWQFAVATLLTDKGMFRQRLTVREGFPPAQKDLKAHAQGVVAALAALDGMADRLAPVQRLPTPEYAPQQWAALEALLTLLPFAAAELKLVFAAEGATDYAEIAAEGRAALGEDTDPSELALRVDWRLQHLLLDEFQDTSQAQYALLRALTRGWAPGDGRTLFLVGDPMQSIYRFRQAEVRLFLDVRDHGLPGLVLEFIRLRANFRSVPALVDWTNRIVGGVFPPEDDLVTSAIAFAPSEPARTGPAADASAVTLHASDWDSPEEETREVVRVVVACLAASGAGSVGILVRSRTHASHIVTALRAAGVEFAASDLVTLGRTALASDLLAITRSLVHAGDRLAWLTMLRAPWCGLTLRDLEAVCAAAGDKSLSDFVLATADAAAGVPAGMTPEGRARLHTVAAALAAGLARLGQIPLRDVVEGVWLDLGGPAVAGPELALVDLILDEIGRHDTGGDCRDVLALARALDQTRASLPGATARVQVLTIHKAKGLQFDTVLLPALGRGIRGERRAALLWQEVVHAGGVDLLLAPVNARGASTDALYELLWGLRREQELAEADRLLYVAVTRARERLHLFGQTRSGPIRSGQMSLGRAGAGDAAPAPASGSLLARLWPAIRPAWPELPACSPAGAGDGTPTEPSAHWQQPALWRLPAGWCRPLAPTGLRLPSGEGALPRSLVAYDWASAWARHAGSVAHSCLQQIALAGIEQYSEARLEALRPALRRQLLALGVAAASVDRALERVVAALTATLADPNGRWVLSAAHAGRLNEFAVTVVVPDESRFQHLVIDRAFIDGDGVRWIIDYKTGTHEGGDRAAFVRSEVERYAPQLRAYREAFASLENRPVKTALYFPLLQLLQIVDAGV